MIRIDTSVSSWAAGLADVSKRTMNKAFAHAANSSILETRTFLLKALTETGLKRKYAAAALVNTKATVANLTARLEDGGRRVPLTAFSPRQKVVRTERGKRLGVTIIQGGERQLVPGGFLVTLKSGRTGIFQRVGSERLPIKQLFSSHISDLIRGISGLEQAARVVASEAMRKNFTRDFEFYKAKEKAK